MSLEEAIATLCGNAQLYACIVILCLYRQMASILTFTQPTIHAKWCGASEGSRADGVVATKGHSLVYCPVFYYSVTSNKQPRRWKSGGPIGLGT